MDFFDKFIYTGRILIKPEATINDIAQLNNQWVLQ